MYIGGRRAVVPGSIRYIIYSALIAAIYSALTLLLAPISYGVLQIRVSEALCILPCFTGAAVPGLFIGCLIANLIGGMGLYDIIFGSLATLLAAVATRLLRKSKWLAPLPAVLLNAVLVGGMLYYVTGKSMSIYMYMLYIGLEQLIPCYLLGVPLMLLLGRYSHKIFMGDR